LSSGLFALNLPYRKGLRFLCLGNNSESTDSRMDSLFSYAMPNGATSCIQPAIAPFHSAARSGAMPSSAYDWAGITV